MDKYKKYKLDKADESLRARRILPVCNSRKTQFNAVGRSIYTTTAAKWIDASHTGQTKLFDEAHTSRMQL